MFFIRHPVAAGLLGLAVTALFGTGAVCVWLELRTMGDAPMVLTLSEATKKALESDGRQLWVSIPDGEWLDETVRHYPYSSDSDRRTEVVLTDESRTIFVFAEFMGTLSFAEVAKRTPGGLLSQMSEKRYRTFVASSGLEPSEVPSREQVFCLWTEGSRQDSEFLLGLLAFFAVLGSSFYPLIGQITCSTIALLAARLAGLRCLPPTGVEGPYSSFQFSVLELMGWTTAIAILLSVWGYSLRDTVGQYFSIISFVILHGSITCLALTIIWLVFGKRRLVMRVLASVLVYFMETTEFTCLFGIAHVGTIVADFAIFTFWLIVSLLVIRLAGYRLQWRWPRTAS